MSNAPAVSGSCACGAVTFTSRSLPLSVQCCNCVTCRKLGGAPFMAFADFESDSIELVSEGVVVDPRADTNAVQGSFHTFKLSDKATRGACKACHSHLTMAYHQCPDETSVALGCMDEESVKNAEARTMLRPQKHIYGEQRVGWYDIEKDGLPIWPRFTKAADFP